MITTLPKPNPPRKSKLRQEYLDGKVRECHDIHDNVTTATDGSKMFAFILKQEFLRKMLIALVAAKDMDVARIDSVFINCLSNIESINPLGFVCALPVLISAWAIVTWILPCDYAGILLGLVCLVYYASIVVRGSIERLSTCAGTSLAYAWLLCIFYTNLIIANETPQIFWILCASQLLFWAYRNHAIYLSHTACCIVAQAFHHYGEPSSSEATILTLSLIHFFFMQRDRCNVSLNTSFWNVLYFVTVTGVSIALNGTDNTTLTAVVMAGACILLISEAKIQTANTAYWLSMGVQIALMYGVDAWITNSSTKYRVTHVVSAIPLCVLALYRYCWHIGNQIMNCKKLS